MTKPPNLKLVRKRLNKRIIYCCRRIKMDCCCRQIFRFGHFSNLRKRFDKSWQNLFKMVGHGGGDVMVGLLLVLMFWWAYWSWVRIPNYVEFISCLGKEVWKMGSGRGSVGRAVTSKFQRSAVRIQSSAFTVNCIEHTKIKKKRGREWPF